MRPEVSTYLAVVRAANRKTMRLSPTFVDTLKDILDITDEESLAIGDIMAADMREEFALHPRFATINDAINATRPKQNEKP